MELEENVKNRIKIDIVDDSRDKIKKIAKGILRIRFWAAEIREERTDLIYQRNRRGEGGENNRYVMNYSNPNYQKGKYSNQE